MKWIKSTKDRHTHDFCLTGEFEDRLVCTICGMKNKIPTITKKASSFYVNGKKHEPADYEVDDQEIIMCGCGNKTFWIYQPLGYYETNGICTKCKKSYCFHDG